jgi:O-antigen/teichoic acid export membrane protein
MYYTKLLVPDIRLKRSYAHWSHVKELISAGAWNSVTKLSQVLSDGLDLLITNLFISGYLMGELSIAQQLPTYVSTLINTLINLFNPNLTMYYAKNDIDAVVKELKLSMKFSSFFANIIFCVLVVFGRYFVMLWVPNQDIDLIYSLMLVIMMSIVVSGVTTSLNNVFLVTNKLKTNSLFWLAVSFVNVALVLVLLNTTSLGIYAVAGVSKATGILGNLIFIPIYASRCLKVKWNTFYPIIFRYMGTTVIMLTVFWGIRMLYRVPITWITFIVVCVIAGIAGCVINFFVLLDAGERTILVNMIKSKVRK